MRPARQKLLLVLVRQNMARPVMMMLLFAVAGALDLDDPAGTDSFARMRTRGLIICVRTNIFSGDFSKMSPETYPLT